MMIARRRRRLARILPWVIVNTFHTKNLSGKCFVTLSYVLSHRYFVTSKIDGTKLEKHCFNGGPLLNPVFTERGMSAVKCDLIILLYTLTLSLSLFVNLFSLTICYPPPPPPEKNNYKIFAQCYAALDSRASRALVVAESKVQAAENKTFQCWYLSQMLLIG